MSSNRFGCAVVSVLAAAIVVPLFLNAVANHRLLTLRSTCVQHLRNISVVFEAYRESHSLSNYPPRLSAINWTSSSVTDLVCPGSRVQVGSTSSVDEWTDYIYIVDLSGRRAPDTPLLLCPPANHYGREGCLLYSDGFTRCMWQPEFDRLVDELYANTNLAIAVSETLTKRSEGRYRSRRCPGRG